MIATGEMPDKTLSCSGRCDSHVFSRSAPRACLLDRKLNSAAAGASDDPNAGGCWFCPSSS